MENRQKEILSEIQDMMISIRNEMERLDAKIYEFSQLAEDEEIVHLDLDIDIDVAGTEEEQFVSPQVEVKVTETENVLEIELSGEDLELQLPEEDLPENGVSDDISETESILEELQPKQEPELEPESEQDSEPKLVVETITEAAIEKKAMIDKLTMHQAWRRDMPGSPVKDIRSAISLNDRVLFINSLFNEDASLFQNTITKLNGLNELSEVLAYLSEHFPNWELDSEVVYRFMMAVRRRIVK